MSSHEGHSRLPKDEQEVGTTKPCKCTCGCQPEITYVAELQPEFDRILPSLGSMGELLCFARNRHCILGSNLAMPSLREVQGHFVGSTPNAEIHLDTESWHHAYYVQEDHHQRGTFTSLEFYDKHHNALFRVAQSPDTESGELCQWLNTLYHRNVPIEELAGWNRMGQLEPGSEHVHAGPSHRLIDIDTFARPIDSTQRLVYHERGYDGSLPLAYAVMLELAEEEQDPAITVSGSFGRMSAIVSPALAQQLTSRWIYFGGAGQSLRIDLSAVATYWIGNCGIDANAYSYLEAVDAFGDLIFRISSANQESSRYWQSLAASMQSQDWTPRA